MAAWCRASARRCSSTSVYSEDGQPLTGSFTDYALPRAADVPFFRIDYHSVPAKTNVLGAKGCGEAGCAGSLPSVMNAIVDALGGKHINMPATPERVWEALHSCSLAEDVAIVGYGPVGALLANLLGQAGLVCRRLRARARDLPAAARRAFRRRGHAHLPVRRARRESRRGGRPRRGACTSSTPTAAP